LRATGDAAGDTDRQATENEERGERDDEGGESRLDHDQAVEPAYDDRHRKGREDSAPERETEFANGEADDDPGKSDHRADGQIELAGDDEQRRRRGDDAELRRKRQER